MVDSTEIGFRVNVVNFTITGDFATYQIKIMGPNKTGLHIRDRYSGLLAWTSAIKKTLGPNV
jgi:hypothetical protein